MINNPKAEFNRLVTTSTIYPHISIKMDISVSHIQIDLSFNETFVRRSRRRIAQLGTRIQYSAPGGFISSSGGIEDADSPIDAVNVVLRNLLRGPSDPLL